MASEKYGGEAPHVLLWMDTNCKLRWLSYIGFSQQATSVCVCLCQQPNSQEKLSYTQDSREAEISVQRCCENFQIRGAQQIGWNHFYAPLQYFPHLLFSWNYTGRENTEWVGIKKWQVWENVIPFSLTLYEYKWWLINKIYHESAYITCDTVLAVARGWMCLCTITYPIKYLELLIFYSVSLNNEGNQSHLVCDWLCTLMKKQFVVMLQAAECVCVCVCVCVCEIDRLSAHCNMRMLLEKSQSWTAQVLAPDRATGCWNMGGTLTTLHHVCR